MVGYTISRISQVNSITRNIILRYSVNCHHSGRGNMTAIIGLSLLLGHQNRATINRNIQRNIGKNSLLQCFLNIKLCKVILRYFKHGAAACPTDPLTQRHQLSNLEESPHVRITTIYSYTIKLSP